MTVSPINLDALVALDDLGRPEASGKPLLLDIELVHEDPAQPRKTFNDIKQLELSASIAESGMRVPVSVRPHPLIPGHYMLNFGARRRRAAISVGLEKIPALIDNLLTDFDQIIENLQRADLTPMEMALFISEKQKGGMKPAEIARRLGLTRSAISKYFALVDAPADIEGVYTSGRTTSPDTIYELRLVHNQWPAETSAWLAKGTDVTRRSIDQLKQTLSQSADVAARARKTTAVVDPCVVSRPIVVVCTAHRFGVLLLNRRASSDDHVLVRWNDTDEVEEISASALQLIRLDDASAYGRRNRTRLRGRSMEISR